MNAVLEALNLALVAAIPLVVSALAAYAVSWLRAHTTASAVRQATDFAGGTPEAAQLAADELHRMPWLLRPGNVPKAVGKAVAREQLKRASVAPPPTPIDVQAPDDEDGRSD